MDAVGPCERLHELNVCESIRSPARLSPRPVGISRSEFFVHAARRYLEDLDARSVVEQIDAALDLADDSNSLAATAGRERLAAVDDEW
jgi:hypothetical protein